MKKSKLIITVLSVALIALSSVFCVSAQDSTVDSAVISQEDDKYVPLYTVSPDSSLKNHSGFRFSAKDYELFYTQTTLPALIAGYLILFKVKGLKSSEKMHSRRSGKK